MKNKAVISRQTAAMVRRKLQGEATGHDWWHVARVWRLARTIAKKEHADPFVTSLAALLHDIADWKFNSGDLEAGPRQARLWLKSRGLDAETTDRICGIVRDISFKGAGVKVKIAGLEGKVVQDADRLDALGAIGIARAFAYGGMRGREIYNPSHKPESHHTFKQYRDSRGTTINHFYEKLLLLRDRMNTKTGRQMARHRHAFMEKYLKQFFKEWG